MHGFRLSKAQNKNKYEDERISKAQKEEKKYTAIYQVKMLSGLETCGKRSPQLY